MSSAPSRSSADAVGGALDRAADTLVQAVTASERAFPIVLIDGRSGAGKSTLARLLVARWPGDASVQLLALDSVYPGWDGLDAGVELMRDDILAPHADGRIARWRRWDWIAERPAEAYAVDPELPLIVEGSGILTPETAVLAAVRVWVESPEGSRRSRALDRDGEAFRPHWDRWARQEDEHVRRDRPATLATHTFLVP